MARTWADVVRGVTREEVAKKRFECALVSNELVRSTIFCRRYPRDKELKREIFVGSTKLNWEQLIATVRRFIACFHVKLQSGTIVSRTDFMSHSNSILCTVVYGLINSKSTLIEKVPLIATVILFISRKTYYRDRKQKEYTFHDLRKITTGFIEFSGIKAETYSDEEVRAAELECLRLSNFNLPTFCSFSQMSVFFSRFHILVPNIERHHFENACLRLMGKILSGEDSGYDTARECVQDSIPESVDENTKNIAFA